MVFLHILYADEYRNLPLINKNNHYYKNSVFFSNVIVFVKNLLTYFSKHIH